MHSHQHSVILAPNVLNNSNIHLQRHDSDDELFNNQPPPANHQSALPIIVSANEPPIIQMAPNPEINNNIQGPQPVLEENMNENNANGINDNNNGSQNSEHAQYNQITQQKVLLECFWNMLFDHFVAIFFICKFIYGTHYGLIFLILFLQDAYDVQLILPRLGERKSYKIFIFEKFLTILVQVMILLYIMFGRFYITLTTLPMLTLFLMRMIKYGMDKYLRDCQSIIDFFSIGFKLFMFLQGVTIFCKIDTFLTWNWSEVFWPYWVLFSVLIGINFGMLFMFLSKLCQILWGSGSMTEFKGIVWMEILCICFTVISAITVISLSSFLDGSNDDNGLFFVLYTIVTSFCVNVVILFYWRKDLIEFLITNAEENQEEEGSLKAQKVHEPNWIMNTAIPRFLTKFSATYFKKAEITSAYLKERMKQTNKNPQNPSNQKPNTQKANFNNKKSASFSNLEKKLASLESAKHSELINNNQKSKNNQNLKSELEKDNVKIDQENQLLSKDSVVNIIDPSEKYPLPNQTIQINDNFIIEKSPPLPMHQGDNTPSVTSANKLPHNKTCLHVVIERPKGRNDSKKFPFSATLPPSRSNKIQTSPKQSMEEITTPSIKKPKESDSNLNQQCLVCFDKIPNAVFMNCGHGGICYECALEIFKNSKECYLCRQKIVQVLQIETTVIADDYIKVIQGIKLQSIAE